MKGVWGFPKNQNGRIGCKAETLIFSVCTDTGCACYSLKSHSKTERVESTRRRYGEFQNVFLSGEECSRLETAYPGKAAEYIERLSRYMASNDRHYANHYATIKKWLDEDSKGRSAKNYSYDDNEGECL